MPWTLENGSNRRSSRPENDLAEAVSRVVEANPPVLVSLAPRGHDLKL